MCVCVCVCVCVCAATNTCNYSYPSLHPQCSVVGSGGVQLVECREEELVPGLLIANSHLEPSTSNSSIRARQAMLMLQSDREEHLKEIDVNRFEDNEVREGKESNLSWWEKIERKNSLFMHIYQCKCLFYQISICL